ncbi:Peptidoglycan-binding lysin domain protein [Desulfarculus baarsii DSM 2075]|uniref:Peptidoglycan-binding lysin domain protein n=1 Tax=Desulfarculus baarsii (strain ATCC 33931 / DSM 2075 / LMG 7858 / VKM B-1802 / 2st14) TaxID=644282 RepID=E1QEQ7_DESB2|nr:LysM peptidoglycan-binding domain-containing protein [Desulfarculus baarsii]ADK84043.1 Peptidoglycan-binding lysin domain protein [Desulfarculus baarsii DSM 2075]
MGRSVKRNIDVHGMAQRLKKIKLSSLEAVLGGLILVGMLYLVSIWMGAFGAADRPATQAEAAPQKGKLNAAIVASERALARLEAMEADIEAMRRRMDEAGLGDDKPDGLFGGAREAGQSSALAAADPNVARKLDDLERRMGPFDKGNSAQRMTVMERLGRLERQMVLLAKWTNDVKNAMGQTAKGAAPSPTIAAVSGRQQTVKAAAVAKPKSKARAANNHRIVYKVRAGDTLARIARVHAVTIADIQRWNPDIGSGHRIMVGQGLVIFSGEAS